MHEDDVRRVMFSPITMIGSDGLPHDAHPHPRLWGTFPRVLGHYARDLALFSMEEAIHKMTGLPARVFGLKGRGSLAPGNYADLVLFDPEAVIDRATYDSPRLMAVGISRVYVNGALAFREGGGVTRRAGRLTGGNNI
jgi:N-acyl-D-amino-acid deacylase